MEIKCKKKHFSLKPLGNQKLFYLEVYKNCQDTYGFVQHQMQNKTVIGKTLHIEKPHNKQYGENSCNLFIWNFILVIMMFTSELTKSFAGRKELFLSFPLQTIMHFNFLFYPQEVLSIMFFRHPVVLYMQIEKSMQLFMFVKVLCYRSTITSSK